MMHNLEGKTPTCRAKKRTCRVLGDSRKMTQPYESLIQRQLVGGKGERKRPGREG
jgi:hypothetical protein